MKNLLVILDKIKREVGNCEVFIETDGRDNFYITVRWHDMFNFKQYIPRNVSPYFVDDFIYMAKARKDIEDKSKAITKGGLGMCPRCSSTDFEVEYAEDGRMIALCYECGHTWFQ